MIKPIKSKSSVGSHETGIVTNKESKKSLHLVTSSHFAYNSSVNRSTGLNPFEIVTGYKPKKPIGLPFHIGDWSNALAESFA